MRPDQPATRGFAIVSALFLVVALAALGAAIMHFSSVQHLTGAQDIQGSRALAAARAGTEWAAAYVTAHSACPASPSTLTFGDFSVSVACSSSSHSDEGSSLTVYAITSTASTGGSVGSLGYVERQVSATLVK
ncbi:MAG: hypothetical protein N3C63_08685 [Rhodocyclaceae bacterium]|nr:hypothetical protein [Rhodocyclaceae bacterium]